MKVSKLEWAVLGITLLTLAAMLFYLCGSVLYAAPVTIHTVESEQSSTAFTSVINKTEMDQVEQDTPFPINLNTATVDELVLLPGIGEVRAQAIVDYRTEHGPFRYVEDIRHVKGIGEATLAQLMDYITVSEGEADNG